MGLSLRFSLPKNSLSRLLACNIVGCLVILFLLELWRPCFFLTDDNLSVGFPILTEIGRHLKTGQSPFFSDYIFGGHYDLLRDMTFIYWHPLDLVASLLSDTPARFWIVDFIALLQTLLATVGFTILARSLRDEFNPTLPDLYLIFFTLSYIFSSYFLTAGSSWTNILGNQSALPWLVLGILHRKLNTGIALVVLSTLHEILSGYIGLIVTGTFFLTLFALAATIYYRSPRPLFIWCFGSILAVLFSTPLLLHLLDGFVHTPRVGGLSLQERSEFAIPAFTFPFSFFLGNWSELAAGWSGDFSLHTLLFPFLSIIMACAGAWCVIPAIFNPQRWRYMEILCFGFALFLVVLIIRPQFITEVMFHIPIVRSLRWPFRDGLLFLFFVHLFLILRPQGRTAPLQPAVTLFSLAMFIAPLPFSRVPTFNPLTADREVLFSGQAESFWTQVKTRLKPTDEIVAVVDLDLWNKSGAKIPYSLLGTADFPAYYQILCASGYSNTAPLDQVPLQTRPRFWFGAFNTDQVDSILAEKPDLKLIRLESVDPLKITLSDGKAPPVDLTPYLPK